MSHHSLHLLFWSCYWRISCQKILTLSHALEPVINLLHGAGFASSSTDTLMKNHLFMPTLKQFIYGDGMYMTGQLEVGRYYGHTDSGFLRQILYGGVSYALVCFAVTFYFCAQSCLKLV